MAWANTPSESLDQLSTYFWPANLTSPTFSPSQQWRSPFHPTERAMRDLVMQAHLPLGDLTASLYPGVGNLTTRRVTGVGHIDRRQSALLSSRVPLTNSMDQVAQTHRTFPAPTDGAVWLFRLSPSGVLGYIWPHPGQIPTISRESPGHAIDRCIIVEKQQGKNVFSRNLFKKWRLLATPNHAKHVYSTAFQCGDITTVTVLQLLIGSTSDRRVTAMRTTSSGIHIRSDDDEKKFFLIRRLSFVSGALLGRLNVSVSMSFLRCKLFRTGPPPPPPPALRVAPKTYRTVAGPPSPRPSDKKRKKKARRERKQPMEKK